MVFNYQTDPDHDDVPEKKHFSAFYHTDRYESPSVGEFYQGNATGDVHLCSMNVHNGVKSWLLVPYYLQRVNSNFYPTHEFRPPKINEYYQSISGHVLKAQETFSIDLDNSRHIMRKIPEKKYFGEEFIYEEFRVPKFNELFYNHESEKVEACSSVNITEDRRYWILKVNIPNVFDIEGYKNVGEFRTPKIGDYYLPRGMRLPILCKYEHEPYRNMSWIYKEEVKNPPQKQFAGFVHRNVFRYPKYLEFYQDDKHDMPNQASCDHVGRETAVPCWILFKPEKQTIFLEYVHTNEYRYPKKCEFYQDNKLMMSTMAGCDHEGREGTTPCWILSKVEDQIEFPGFVHINEYRIPKPGEIIQTTTGKALYVVNPIEYGKRWILKKKDKEKKLYVYEETDEFRPPKKGEYFKDLHDVIRVSSFDHLGNCVIVNRKEKE